MVHKTIIVYSATFAIFFKHLVVTSTVKYNCELFRYVWLEIPNQTACYGAKVRWWQNDDQGKYHHSDRRLNYAIDSIVIGGSRSGPPDSLVAHHLSDFNMPMWIQMYNVDSGENDYILWYLERYFDED